MKLTSFLNHASPHLLSILRIITAFLFVEHGTSKVLNFPPQAAYMTPDFHTMAGLSGLIELVGGFLLLAGLFTRLAAFILSGEMAVAYFMVHAPNGFFPLVNKGEIAVLYCFVFLYFVFAGGGPWSLDRLLCKRSSS